IEHEHRRQVEAFLEDGVELKPGLKSTRGWDDEREVTFLQREKEEAEDYRYFPDPDLVPVEIDDAWLEQARDRLVELPAARRRRYQEELGLSAVDARTIVADPGLTELFEETLAEGADANRAAALLLNTGARIANEEQKSFDQLPLTGKQAAMVIKLAADDKISSTAADTIIEAFATGEETGNDVEAVAEKKGLIQVSDTGAIEQIVDDILGDPANAPVIEQIRGGKEKAIGALIGKVMKASKGQANPKVAQEVLRERLLKQA
ncbi:MAG: hypothetical protein R3336_01080, partial [Phycisphaeraceae bacterium]|nr:hypothetical protein [Phycisphaeraceae bacterium]